MTRSVAILFLLACVAMATRINNEAAMADFPFPQVDFNWGSPCTIEPPSDGGRSGEQKDTCREFGWPTIQLPWQAPKKRNFECRQESGVLRCLYKQGQVPFFHLCKANSECHTGYCSKFEQLCLHKPKSLTWGSKCVPGLSVSGCPDSLDCFLSQGMTFRCHKPQYSIQTGDDCYVDDECQHVRCGPGVVGCTEAMYGKKFLGSCQPEDYMPGTLPDNSGLGADRIQKRVCSFSTFYPVTWEQEPSEQEPSPWQPKQFNLVKIGHLVGRLQRYDLDEDGQKRWTVSLSNGREVEAGEVEISPWEGSESDFFRFKVGNQVQLDGLQKTTHLEGAQGQLLGYDDERMLWKVEFPWTNKTMLTREKNLLLRGD